MNRATAPGLRVTEVKLRLAPGHDRLLGWASCLINNSILLNDIALRKGHDGGLYITFPVKVTANGTKCPVYFPVSRQAAATLRRAILQRLAEIASDSPERGER